MQAAIRTEVETGLSPARLRIAVGRLSRRLRPTSAAGSLTPSEVDVLVAVERRGPVRLGELALAAGFNPTMLSRLVARLEVMQLVRRSGDKADRRVSLVEITVRGRRLLEKVRSERDDILTSRLAHLETEERLALARALPVLEGLAESLAGPEERSTLR
jgi:DNA-binding MarR family transcriptional regulator